MWERTHRLGGRVFVLVGLVLVLGVVVGLPQRMLLVVIVLGALIPCAYSYVIYRQARSGE